MVGKSKLVLSKKGPAFPKLITPTTPLQDSPSAPSLHTHFAYILIPNSQPYGCKQQFVLNWPARLNK